MHATRAIVDARHADLPQAVFVAEARAIVARSAGGGALLAPDDVRDLCDAQTDADRAAIWASVGAHEATRIFALVTRNASLAGAALLVLHTPAGAPARALGLLATRSRAPSTGCLLYTSPSPRDGLLSRMPSSA